MVVNKRFYCRKLGLLKVGDSSAQSFFFDLGLRWNDLTPKDKKKLVQLCPNFYTQLAVWCAVGNESI